MQQRQNELTRIIGEKESQISQQVKLISEIYNKPGNKSDKRINELEKHLHELKMYHLKNIRVEGNNEVEVGFYTKKELEFAYIDWAKYNFQNKLLKDILKRMDDYQQEKQQAIAELVQLLKSRYDELSKKLSEQKLVESQSHWLSKMIWGGSLSERIRNMSQEKDELAIQLRRYGVSLQDKPLIINTEDKKDEAKKEVAKEKNPLDLFREGAIQILREKYKDTFAVIDFLKREHKKSPDCLLEKLKILLKILKKEHKFLESQYGLYVAGQIMCLETDIDLVKEALRDTKKISSVAPSVTKSLQK